MRMSVVVTANYPYGRLCAWTRRGHDMTETRRKRSTGIVCPSLLCPWNVPPAGVFRGCRKVSAQGGIANESPISRIGVTSRILRSWLPLKQESAQHMPENFYGRLHETLCLRICTLGFQAHVDETGLPTCTILANILGSDLKQALVIYW